MHPFQQSWHRSHECRPYFSNILSHLIYVFCKCNRRTQIRCQIIGHSLKNMAQGQKTQKFIVFGNVRYQVIGIITIAEKIIMGEHSSFWNSGGARRVNQSSNIIMSYLFEAGFNLVAPGRVQRPSQLKNLTVSY